MQIVGFAAETPEHLGRRGWDDIWRCAHLRRLLLYESTCSPSYLLPFSIVTAAAIFPCCLVSSHIRSKTMVSSSKWKYTGWAGAAVRGVRVYSHMPHRISHFKLVRKVWHAQSFMFSTICNSKVSQACLWLELRVSLL